MDITPSSRTSDMGREVAMTITLNVSTARQPIPLYVRRRITFTRDTPYVSIGRASKVLSKGFIAGESNAYFNSPVMSRQHAELLANFEDKTISIRDNGSLHGTFFTSHDTNSVKQLTPNESVKLADRDVIRFGIDIFREKTTFPPTTVTVEMDQVPTQNTTRQVPTNIFSVPDDIDSDDLISESESVVETGRLFQPTAVDIALEQDIIDLTADPDHTLLRDLVMDIASSAPTDYDITGFLDPDGSDTGSVIEDGPLYNNASDSDCESEHDSISDEDPIGFSDIETDLDHDDSDDDDDNGDEDEEDDDDEDQNERLGPELPPRYKSPSDFIFQASNEALVATDEVDLSYNPRITTELRTDHSCGSALKLDPPDAPEESAWECSGTNFINDPESVPPLRTLAGNQSEPVHLDDTSAFTYEQSKAGQTVKRLLISDLLAQEPQSEEVIRPNESFETTSTKRSFETAFPAEEDDNKTTTTSELPATTIHEAPLEVVTTTRTYARPKAQLPKRRRVAEVAACLALGGAGVLSALIYTAPSFA
ncbi:FHA domain-containing protein [Microdochium nivale]|nr:FHA domain-containing protein [Microdochium nivale]